MADMTKPTKKETFWGDDAFDKCQKWHSSHPNVTVNSETSGITDGKHWIEITYWD